MTKANMVKKELIDIKAAPLGITWDELPGRRPRAELRDEFGAKIGEVFSTGKRWRSSYGDVKPDLSDIKSMEISGYKLKVCEIVDKINFMSLHFNNRRSLVRGNGRIGTTSTELVMIKEAIGRAVECSIKKRITDTKSDVFYIDSEKRIASNGLDIGFSYKDYGCRLKLDEISYGVTLEDHYQRKIDSRLFKMDCISDEEIERTAERVIAYIQEISLTQ